MNNLYYITLKKLTQDSSSKKLGATLQCLFFIVSFILDQRPKEFQEIFWSWNFFFFFITK